MKLSAHTDRNARSHGHKKSQAYPVAWRPPSHHLQVRVGLPTPSGRLLAAARQRGYDLLLSANVFARREPLRSERGGQFLGFRMPDPKQFAGLDVALDSAGFVAATRYRQYPWTVPEYMELVAAYPWTWWASMDYCCEPQVADDRPTRLLRMAATVALYHQCLSMARARGLSDPIPVLQGWSPVEYRQSFHWLNLQPCPDLVGVGSVCRRPVQGPDGVLEIVNTLDELLPSGVRLHLFGVSRAALSALANHPRIASTDSMAWDAHARRERPRGRDTSFRIDCMDRWVHRQQWRLSTESRGAGLQTRLPFSVNRESMSFESHVLEALALRYSDLILAGDLGYLDAVWCMKQDAPVVMALIHQGTVTPLSLDTLDEIFEDLSAAVTHASSDALKRLVLTPARLCNRPITVHSRIDPHVARFEQHVVRQ